MPVETREPHPLNNVVAEGSLQKKRLSHVEVKATSDLLSEVRKEANKEGRKSLKAVKPVAKQDLLSAVRTEAGATKKRLSKVETKAVSGLMTQLRGVASVE